MLIRRKPRTPSPFDRHQSNSNICPPEWLPIRPTGPVPTGSAGFNPSIPILPPQTPPNPQPAATSEAPPVAPPSVIEAGCTAPPASEALPGATSPASEGGSSPAPARPKRKYSTATQATHGVPASVIQGAPSKPDPDFHRRRCVICNHQDRADIEAAFLAWQPIDRIVRDYNLADRTTLYRHANAFNLFEQRRQHMQSALDLIIERAGSVNTSAFDVIGAIEMSLRMRGENVAPLYRYETKHIGQKEAQKGEEKANRNTSELTPPITH